MDCGGIKLEILLSVVEVILDVFSYIVLAYLTGSDICLVVMIIMKYIFGITDLIYLKQP